MKRILILSALLLSALTVNAQYSVGSYPCGPASTSPLQCNGFPVTLNGSAVGTGWLHDYLTGSGPDYIVWQAGMDLVPEATIGKSVCVTTATFTSGNQTADQCTFLVVYFHGGDQAAGTYYTGEGTFHFAYTFGGSGITAGWRRTVTGGAIKFVNY
jgi:hypothetical protein